MRTISRSQIARVTLVSLLLGTAGLLFGHLQSQAQTATPDLLQNAKFEEGEHGQAPPGWHVPTPRTHAVLTTEDPAEGQSCVTLTREGEAGGEYFGSLIQQVDPTPLRGKRICFAAQVRHPEWSGQAQLWLCVDRPNQVRGLFDDMLDRPIRAPEWKRYEIVGKVDEDAVSLTLGMVVIGPGKAWIDDAELVVLPDITQADAAPRELTPQGLQNLVAFARLFGYVRHFHPSDEALETDWDQFAMCGVEKVEGAADATALTAALKEPFAPVAPTVQVWTGSATPPAPTQPPETTRWASWRHYGFGQIPQEGRFPVYSSRVVREPLDVSDSGRSGTKAGTTVLVDLGGTVQARVPIGVYSDGSRTLPPSSAEAPELGRPAGWVPSGDDRTVRLADVILAWNIFQHFYPYFDVVQTNWPAALSNALIRAAQDPDPRAFHRTLEMLGAALHDGHNRVGSAWSPTFRAPLDWTWVGDTLVVTQAPAESVSTRIQRGDVILKIDGRSTEQVYAEVSSRISAATVHWRRWRSLGGLLASDKPDEVELSLRHPDSSEETIRVRLISRGSWPAGAAVAQVIPKPENGQELAPGILYFDLRGAGDEPLRDILDTLASAKGVVFDLRGYPGAAGRSLLGHLTTEPMQCAHWNVPIILMPDGQEVTYYTSRWDIKPAEPRFQGKVVFVTDGRAISYAETCLGIIEHFHLGEIVGASTAGTNGNVITISLPGRYTMNFTGMQVIKHDGTQHHGIGIRPTVPADRTVAGIAAGVDEVLNRAVQVALGS